MLGQLHNIMYHRCAAYLSCRKPKYNKHTSGKKKVFMQYIYQNGSVDILIIPTVQKGPHSLK